MTEREPEAVVMLRARVVLPNAKDCDEILNYIDNLTARLAAEEQDAEFIETVCRLTSWHVNISSEPWVRIHCDDTDKARALDKALDALLVAHTTKGNT